jgi:phage shock protein C
LEAIVITMNAESDRRFYRDRDRAVLGGVCAGLAEYLGFNLKVTRILAFIAFLTTMPIAIIVYLAAVFLIPSKSRGDDYTPVEKRSCRRRRRKSKQEQAPAEQPRSSVAEDINRRCASLDERLKLLEKHVTSKRFQLDQELSRL